MRTPDPDIMKRAYYTVESEEEMIEWLLEALLYFSIAKAIPGHILVELQGTGNDAEWKPNFTDWEVVEANEKGFPAPARKVTTLEYIAGLSISLDLISETVKKLSALQKERTFSL